MALPLGEMFELLTKPRYSYPYRFPLFPRDVSELKDILSDVMAPVLADITTDYLHEKYTNPIVLWMGYTKQQSSYLEYWVVRMQSYDSYEIYVEASESVSESRFELFLNRRGLLRMLDFLTLCDKVKHQTISDKYNIHFRYIYKPPQMDDEIFRRGMDQLMEKIPTPSRPKLQYNVLRNTSEVEIGSTEVYRDVMVRESCFEMGIMYPQNIILQEYVLSGIYSEITIPIAPSIPPGFVIAREIIVKEFLNAFLEVEGELLNKGAEKLSKRPFSSLIVGKEFYEEYASRYHYRRYAPLKFYMVNPPSWSSTIQLIL